MAARGGSWDGRFPRYVSAPALAADGIATSKQRGAMAASWWSQRFVDVLESYGLGARMQRGRAYARKGQVLTLDVGPAVIVAKVQGSRKVPYQVRVAIRTPLTAAQWKKVDTAMAAKVGFVVRLLADELPAELEEVFDAAGVDLFAHSWRALDARCSCPDSENPCKHIAAVLYVYADQLDRDPWLLLAWHGRTRDAVMRTLRERGGASGAPPDARAPAAAIAPWWPLTPGLPLPTGEASAGDAEAPEVAHAVLTALENLELRRQGVLVTDLIKPVYAAFLEPRT